MNPGLIAESSASSASLSPGHTRHSVWKGRSSLGTFLHSLGSLTYMTSALEGVPLIGDAVDEVVWSVLNSSVPKQEGSKKRKEHCRSHMRVVPCFVFSVHVTPLMKSGLVSSVKAVQGFSTSVHSCWLRTCERIPLGSTRKCTSLEKRFSNTVCLLHCGARTRTRGREVCAENLLSAVPLFEFMALNKEAEVSLTYG